MKMKSSGYAISAQKSTPGKPTGGGSPVHARMKPGILKGEGPKDSGATTDNRKMYKSGSSKDSGKAPY
jgi:hypothetical protein